MLESDGYHSPQDLFDRRNPTNRRDNTPMPPAQPVQFKGFSLAEPVTFQKNTAGT
jgi:hypothetical protein